MQNPNFCPACGHDLKNNQPTPLLGCTCGTNGICNLHAYKGAPQPCLFDNPEYQNKPMGLVCPCPKHAVTC